MKMKNTEYKIKKENIVYIMRENKTQYENIIEHKI